MKFHELRIDHKLVNAESQQNVDFRTRKAIKQRKNTYGGSPNANLDQRNSGMKQNFNLELLDLILVIFTQKGGGIYRKSGTVRIFYRISCRDLVRTLVEMLW